MTAVMISQPATSPKTAPFIERCRLYRYAAEHAKEQLASMFMMQPMIPVSLTVTISTRETRADMAKAAIGPYMNPPMVMITSFGSYFKNNTMGTRPTNMTT